MMLDQMFTDTKVAAGGWVILGIFIIRWIGLRISKDAITIKADASDRSAITMLQDRVNRLDARVNELETARNRLFGFVTKCMAYISQCQCEGVEPPSKQDLQKDYHTLIGELDNHFNGANDDKDD